MRGVTVAILLLIVVIAPVCAGTFNFGGDKYYVYSTSDGKSWNLVTNVGNLDFSKPTTYKIAIESGKNVVNGIYIQLLKDASIVVDANFQTKNCGFVQYNTEKYEGYYSYGGSYKIPWVTYWQVYPKLGTMVYTDFTNKKIIVKPVSQKWIDMYIKTPVNAGNLPSLTDIEVMAGV